MHFGRKRDLNSLLIINTRKDEILPPNELGIDTFLEEKKLNTRKDKGSNTRNSH